MDARKIKKLIELVKEMNIGELEVKSGEDSVRINCQINTGQIVTQYASPPQQSQAILSQPAVSVETATPPKHAPHIQGHTVKSPMVGTVYLASAPGNPPFVKVGDTVKIGDTLCMVEAMKMFNKIEADKAGVISARLIENAQPVEYDQPLFIIEE